MILINWTFVTELPKKVTNQNEIPMTNNTTNNKDLVNQHFGIVLTKS